jgi:uncharacterized membrane protein YgdD (TMEM256/DUF423 family)
MMPAPNRPTLAAAALLGALAVMLGAFGAHALRSSLGAQQLGWWQTATQYQLAHAITLLVIAILPYRRAPLAAWCMALGTIVFSGTLYLMALGLPLWLGAITPVGGLLLIAGWLMLGWGALERDGSTVR